MLPDHTCVCVSERERERDRERDRETETETERQRVFVHTNLPSHGIADSYGSFIPSFLRNLHCLVAKSRPTLCNPMDYNLSMEFFRQEY